MDYETIIGIEIHAELSTKTKAFCGCEYKYGAEVNTQCCPVCTAMPGALPVLNKSVVDYAIKMGLATGCTINHTTKFDRKNYFYPDLPSGYQVTQNDLPICTDGAVPFYHKGKQTSVRLTRIHMEEDTSKLIHDDNLGGLLIDFNRCGVPLIEIVTEPDLRSGEEARDFLESLRMLLGTLDICNCKMQEGAIRCDINVSVRPVGQQEFGTRVEMKNVNTFSGAVTAIEYEANRQIEILKNGGTIHQETRRWDEHKEQSIAMRTKETAADYRYFPEPNLPPLVVDDAWIESVRQTIPELPYAKLERYLSIGVCEAEAWLLIEQLDKSRFFEECIKQGSEPNATSKWLMGHITGALNKVSMDIGQCNIKPSTLVDVLAMVNKGTISLSVGKKVLDEIFANGGTPQEVVDRLGLGQISDEGALKQLVTDVLANNQKSIDDFKNGKSNAFGFLVGQCMKASKGQGNPQMIDKLIKEALGI